MVVYRDAAGRTVKVPASRASGVPLTGREAVWAPSRHPSKRSIATWWWSATTGRLVGYTDLTVRPATPHLAIQADTLVLTEHRGHGLGQAMKVAEIRALTHELPQVTTLRTWNAQTNTHMIAVNQALGFYESGFTHEWAKDL